MKTVIGMVKINLKLAKTAYLITGLVFALVISNYIVAATVNSPDNSTVAIGNYLYLLPLFMAIFIPAQNFSKLMNLGGKRTDFFKSSILTYLPVIVAVTLLSIISNLTVDRMMVDKVGLLELLDIFGFMARGPVVAFFQMCAFLLLFCCTLHTLTLAQGRWYGLAADVLIVSIVSVFTPIVPLRAALVWFFNMIIFHNIAIVQILFCLIVGAIIYCVSLIPIKSKQI